MKRPLEEAAELFRESERHAGADRDKAALYRGLRLLADGLRRLEKEIAEMESEVQTGPTRFYQRRTGILKGVRAIPVSSKQGKP